MISTILPGDMPCQRWREGRTSYRPRGETIDASKYEVAPMLGDDAREFVIRHHYSASTSTVRRAHGLYRGTSLVGVAIYGNPLRNCVLTGAFPGLPVNALTELARFVLLDDVEANGESWFLARSHALLRKDEFLGIVSFSDPMAREDDSGNIVMPGHVGTIYQATNAVYLGQRRGDYVNLLRDGRIFPRRAVTKIENGERGWDNAACRLVEIGASTPVCLRRGTPDPVELNLWVRHWLPKLSRKVKHPGNHKYAFGLTKKIKKRLPKPDPKNYPKKKCEVCHEVHR